LATGLVRVDHQGAARKTRIDMAGDLVVVAKKALTVKPLASATR
jgi:hypothetical protein